MCRLSVSSRTDSFRTYISMITPINKTMPRASVMMPWRTSGWSGGWMTTIPKETTKSEWGSAVAKSGQRAEE